MKPNIPENKRNRKKAKPGPARSFDKAIFKERFRTIERVFAWEDKFKRALIRFEHISHHYFGVKLLSYSLINLRHFIKESFNLLKYSSLNSIEAQLRLIVSKIEIYGCCYSCLDRK